MDISLNGEKNIKNSDSFDENNDLADVEQNETINRSNTVIVNINFKSKRLLREEFNDSKPLDFKNQNKFEEKKLLNL